MRISGRRYVVEKHSIERNAGAQSGVHLLRWTSAARARLTPRVSRSSYADARRPPLRTRATHYWRVLAVIAVRSSSSSTADSSLGYVWSLVKPLSYFGYSLGRLLFGRFLSRRGSELPALSPDRNRSLHVLRRCRGGSAAIGRRPWGSLATACAHPTDGDPYRRNPHVGDHVRRELVCGRRVRARREAGAADRLAPHPAAPSRALCVHPRPCSSPLGLFRALPRRLAAMGARRSATALRLRRHVSRRVSTALVPGSRLSQPVLPGDAGHPRLLLGTRPAGDETIAAVWGSGWARLVPIAIASVLFRRRSGVFPARRADFRGEGVMAGTPAVSSTRFEVVRNPA